MIRPKPTLVFGYLINTVGQKIWKIQAKKKLVKSNKSISQFFFDQIPFFAILKMAKTQFLKWEKNLKLSRMQFHKKMFLIYWFSRVFLPGLLLNFLAHCVIRHYRKRCTADVLFESKRLLLWMENWKRFLLKVDLHIN